MNDASGWVTTALVPQGLVSHIKAPIPNVLEVMDSIQLATGKGFAIINLADVFCSVPVYQQRLSCRVPSLLKGHNAHLPGYTTGYLKGPAIVHSLCRQDCNCIHICLGSQV